jgi:pyruvate-formate lyase-activating enzyme
MKNIKTFEGYVSSITEGLSSSKMKELIAEMVEQLTGQLDDEGVTADEVEDFLEENPSAAESTLEGLEDKYGEDLINLWPKMKAEVIKKVKSSLDESRVSSTTESAGCMSETMMEKCNEMCEAMCAEMKACHEDATEKTAESYKAECSEKLKEMMKVVEKMCNEYMGS